MSTKYLTPENLELFISNIEFRELESWNAQSLQNTGIDSVFKLKEDSKGQHVHKIG